MKEKTKENKIFDKLSDILSRFGERMMSIGFLSAISETMQAVTPIILIGSIMTLITSLDIGPWQKIITSIPNLVTISSIISQFTTGMFSLYVLLIMSYMYGKRIELKENIACIPITAMTFLILLPYSADGIGYDWLGMPGLIMAMVIGIFTPKLMKFMIDHNIRIHMPSGIPKFVEDGFTVLIPGLLIAIVCGVVNVLMGMTSFESVPDFIFKIIQTPITNVGLSLPGVTFIMCLTAATMWCGIHSNTVAGVLVPLLYAANLEDAAAIAAGGTASHIVNYSFCFNLTLPGGCGALLIPALIAAFYCKSNQLKSIGRISVVPAIFGIGEPTLFGMPVMLNPMLFIPLILGVFVNNIVAYAAIASGLVGMFNGTILPWTTPPIMGAMLASTTPIRAAILNVVLLVIDILIWVPFMKIFDKNCLKQEAEEREAIEKNN